MTTLMQPIPPSNLTVLCRKHPRPQKWELQSGKIPGPLAGSSQPRISHKSFFYPKLSEKQLRTLRKRGTLPHFGPGFRHDIHRVTVNCTGKSPRESVGCPKKSPSSFSARDLGFILKGAKNLKVLHLHPECRKPTFKSIRKLQGLRDLSLTIRPTQILSYPQLFKRLVSLQKVNLSLYLWLNDKNHSKTISKFFGFLLNLPKLYHLTVWLDGSFNYYKTLLHAIHQKKLSSFHIIVSENSDKSEAPENWGNSVETLILCGVYPLEANVVSRNYWFFGQKPGKILRFQHGLEIADLIKANLPIKNLEIHRLSQENSYPDCLQKIRTLISQAKLLEKLVLELDIAYKGKEKFIAAFNREFSQVESLENLQAFYFKIRKDFGSFSMISNFVRRNEDPYSSEIKPEKPMKILPFYISKMKNLKTLSLNLQSPVFDLSNFTESLTSLGTLEEFYFLYSDWIKQGKVECKFPFEFLKNLRYVWIYCDHAFSENSIKHLAEGVLKMEKLNYLEITGETLVDLSREKFDALKEYLCANHQSLKDLKLRWQWKELNGRLSKTTCLVKMNGEWVVTSE